jgi:hypothetical protein
MFGRHATARAVRLNAPREPGVGRCDYADAFEIRLPASDPRTAEGFARDALEHAPWLMRAAVRVGWGLLGFRLGPRTSPDHVFGAQITARESTLVKLEVRSPLMRGVIVGRRLEPTRVVVATYVTYERPRAARPLWAALSPVHRFLAKRLMELAAAIDSTKSGS